MNKTWSVFKHEFLKTVSRRSFILTLILVPLVPAVILWILGNLSDSQSQSLQQVFTGGQPQSALPYGAVDHSGLLTEAPDWVTGGSIVLVPSSEEARLQVQQGKLKGYYEVAEDYLESGRVTLYREDVNPVTGFEQTGVMENLIAYNLLGRNQDLYLRYTNPVSFVLEEVNPAIAETRDTEDPLAFFIPYGVTLFFYMIVFITSSMLLNTVGKDKDNRVMEMLLSSVKPTSLFVGKLTGLGLASLLQLAIWFGAALALLRFSGRTFSLPMDLNFSPALYIYGILFFIVGFVYYGSLMAGIGAMAPNLREGSQSTFMVALPLILTLVSINSLIQMPHGSLATILSLLPPTAPVAMMTRLTIGGVPGWQIGLALGLLALIDVFLIKGVANLFRSQHLLTGSKFSFKLFLRELVRR
ncbi:MAG: ABC transporter permease [Chloroflexi bacterium]|jgi:ABC-2 type transport system permease protein|nr:ABC transporter permease [Anaerolineaceae bacterium]NLI44830.1 ABC transporter permease [Chloroflexota bacterium]HOE35703.1 ABC transporter permease [Anaerolineaceae bacterium]HOT26266.1 ABC transporter permease [Anaerolineaceae bacterium]HQH58209.1 ABC transporter permease [Anaerolineaceae bacterium]